MYQITDLEKLLSKNAEALLKQNNNELFNQFEPQVQEIVVSIAGVDPLSPPAWVKQPFAWILDYLVQPRLSGQSPEFLGMISEHYRQAVKILEKNASKTTDLASKTVEYNDLYTNEIE